MTNAQCAIWGSNRGTKFLRGVPAPAAHALPTNSPCRLVIKYQVPAADYFQSQEAGSDTFCRMRS